MKSKFYKSLLASVMGASMLSMSSCTDLSETIYSQIASEKYEFTDEDAQSMFSPVYTSLRDFYWAWYGYADLDICTDLWCIPLRIGVGWGDLYISFHKHEFNANLGHLSGAWNNAYAGVNACNRLLADEAVQNSETSVAQLRAYRALYYYLLFDMFRNIPLDTSFEHPDGWQPEQVTPQEMWDFIISEIDQAIEDGLAETAESVGRIDIYTALALKARAAIYAASIARYNSPIEGIGNYVDPDTGKQVCGIPASDAEYYYKIAFDAAKEIIKSGKYSLARGLSSDGADNFALLFQDPTKHNEDIFVKQFQYPALTHWWDYYHLPAPWGQSWYDNPTLDLVLMYEKLDGSEDELAEIGEWGPEIPSPDYYFTGRDYRFAGTCYYPGGPFPGGDGTFDIRRGLIEESGSVYDGTGQATIGGNQYNIRGTYGMGEWFETQTGFLCRKYILESNIANVSASQPSDQTWIAIRYAEILLIAAEAAAELGTDEENIGLDSINDIRTRAGLKETGTLTVDEVRKQWVCEMVFENQIFWCMRRWRTLDTKLTDNFKCKGVQPFWDPVRDIWKIKVVDACRYPKTSFQNRYYYGWINTSFIATNPQIKQNYGY